MNVNEIKKRIKKLDKLSSQLQTEIQDLNSILSNQKKTFRIFGYTIEKTNKENSRTSKTNTYTLNSEDSFEDDNIYDTIPTNNPN